MVISIGVLPKKRGRPATGQDPMLDFRAPRSLAAALDAWLAAQAEPRPSRSEAIRRLLAQTLEKPASDTLSRLTVLVAAPALTLGDLTARRQK